MKTVMDMALEAGFTERELIRAVENLTRFNQLIRADERDECACLCDALERTKVYGAKECAEGIRARGNT